MVLRELARHPLGWLVIAADGTYISTHNTKQDAAANLTTGPRAAAHYAILDWYLGYSRDSGLPPLTDAERARVAQIVSDSDVANGQVVENNSY